MIKEVRGILNKKQDTRRKKQIEKAKKPAGKQGAKKKERIKRK